MIRTTIREVGRVLGAEILGGPGRDPLSSAFPSVSIDSRTLQPGECFVALQGPRFDGHDYIDQAVAKGAEVLIVSRPSLQLDAGFVLRVGDTKVALQELGLYLRRKWANPLVAVTGSMGKTTTRGFAASLLSSRFRVFESPGNLNNEFGVPLSLSRLSEDDEIAVLELGMNHRGEIHDLCEICLPDMGVLTNVAPVHLEFFSGLSEIAQAKGELIESLDQKGQLVFNADDRRVLEMAMPFAGRKISFALEAEADVRVTDFEFLGLEEMVFELVFWNRRLRSRVPFAGYHYLYNLAAAVAVSLGFGLELEEIEKGLAGLQPLEMRGRVLRVQGRSGEPFTLLDDSYNSNPGAVQTQLRSLSRMSGFSRKIVALGEMMELGKSAPELHRQVGREVARSGIDFLVTVGEGARRIQEGALEKGFSADSMEHFEDSERAAEFLYGWVGGGDLLVCKGSRALRMEKIVQRLGKSQEGEPA